MRRYVDAELINKWPCKGGYFYECVICQSVIPAKPLHNIHCECRNTMIDIDQGRISVKTPEKVRKIFDDSTS